MTRPSGVLLLSVLAVGGCHTHSYAPLNAVSAVMTPNFRTGRLGVQCLVSSSGTCYFTLFGLSTGRAKLEIATGERKVLSGINEDTLYCAESQMALMEHCTQLLLPREQAIVTRNIYSEQPVELAR